MRLTASGGDICGSLGEFRRVSLMPATVRGYSRRLLHPLLLVAVGKSQFRTLDLHWRATVPMSADRLPHVRLRLLDVDYGRGACEPRSWELS